MNVAHFSFHFFSIFIGIDWSCLSHQPFLWHWSLANRTKLWQAGRKTVSFPAFRMNNEYRKIQPRLTSFFVKVWLFFSVILPEDARSPTSWWSWGGSGFAQSVCLKPWSLESHGSWKFVCRGECERETTIRLEWREHLQRILAARLFFFGRAARCFGRGPDEWAEGRTGSWQQVQGGRTVLSQRWQSLWWRPLKAPANYLLARLTDLAYDRNCHRPPKAMGVVRTPSLVHHIRAQLVAGWCRSNRRRLRIPKKTRSCQTLRDNFFNRKLSPQISIEHQLHSITPCAICIHWPSCTIGHRRLT